MSIRNPGFLDLPAFGLFISLRSLFSLLPRRLCLQAGASLGSFLFYADKKHRRIALANLDKALGRDLPPARRRGIARESFRNFGRVIADNVKWSALGKSRQSQLLTSEGADSIRRALDAGKGALLFSAHLGNWEVASRFLSSLGRLSVVARPLDNPLLEGELVRFRQSLGARVISKYQAARPILQALRRNEIVAVLVDQNVLRSQAVFVDFFGLPAATTPSLASFYLRTGAPLIPTFCYPTASSSYLIKVGRPLDIELSGDSERDVLKITQASTKIIEAEIRDHPGLWFWFHNRWKTRPDSQPLASSSASGDNDEPRQGHEGKARS
jgi:KDO2-lipid IV(A) lauroyltransferase